MRKLPSKERTGIFFEDALVKQMRLALEPVDGDFRVIKEQGRVYVLCPEEYDFDEAVEALQCVFGIVGISPVVIYEDQGLEQMGKDVVSYMKNRYPGFPGLLRFIPEEQKNLIRSILWKSVHIWAADPGRVSRGICRCS